ncbi:MAG: nicotinate-nucleotide adenylyltransferase [Cyanobacteria bacterium J06632_22]
MQNIALFGTSADPPHKGHRGILTWLSQQFDHVAVWASDNPFKAGQSPLADRMQMLQLMIEHLPTSPSAGTVQLHAELSHRFTAVTLDRAKAIWPQAAFTFVIGADLVQQMPKWYQSDAIFQQAKILVFPRPGYPLHEHALDELRHHGATVAIATPPQQFDISSSAYRHAATNRQAVPLAVQDYIQAHHLYPCLENSPRPRNAATR